MSDRDTHRRMLQSTATFGGASLLNVFVGIARAKIVAILLGSSGIAVIGMLGTALQTAALVAGMGLRTSAVRELAASHRDPATLARVRKALLVAHVALGLVGATTVWVLSETLSELVFGSRAYAWEMRWVGVGVFLLLLAGARSALLQGLRDIHALARASAIGTGVGAVLSLLAVWWLGAEGIWLYVLCTPAASALAASWLVATRVPRPAESSSIATLAPAWRAMFLLGAAFMVTSSLPLVAKLFVQSQVARGLGLDAAGFYQAAWTLSTHYIGFILAAMAADFYPNLTQKAGDVAATNRLVNAQAHIGMLLAGPLVLGMSACAQYLLPALYARDFTAAAELLRWQVLGDLVKVAGWPIGFVLLAHADRGMFLLTQATWAATYAIASVVGMELWGLSGVGIAFVFACAVGFALNCLIVGRRYGFRYERANLRSLAWLGAGGLLIVVASWTGPAPGLGAGVALASATGMYALVRLWPLVPEERIARHRILRMIDGVIRR